MPVIKSIYKYSIDDMIEKDILIDSRAFDYYNPARRTSEEKAADQTPEEDQIPEEKRRAQPFTKKDRYDDSVSQWKNIFRKREKRRGRGICTDVPAPF